MSQQKFIDRKEELEMLGYDYSRNDSSLLWSFRIPANCFMSFVFFSNLSITSENDILIAGIALKNNNKFITLDSDFNKIKDEDIDIL